MPLLDHFQPPARIRAPWESLLMVWVAHVCRRFNRSRLEDDFIAHSAVWRDDRAGSSDPVGAFVVEEGGNAPPTVCSFEVPRIDRFSVQIKDIRDDMRLVAAIEFVSLSNKNREQERTQFVSKCLSYLDAGIGLVVVDVVTTRSANLHNQLMAALTGPPNARLPDEPIYVAGYRVSLDYERKRIETWPYSVPVGSTIPTVPLALKGGPLVPLDLEGTYTAALTDHNL